MCYSLHLRESFGSDFPVLRLHSDRGGEFSSARLGAFCRAQGIRQTFTLPASPQQNGIAERRIGMVMDVARTSMIHAAAPHFLWPFAVQYAAHQLNLQPRVSVPETSHTLRWTGKVGDASAFRVWGSRAFVRDLSSDKLSPCAVPCVFLGFPPDAPGWQFYHPTSRRVLSSQDVTFDGSVPFYRLFPYRTAPLPPPPLFLAPGPPPVDPLPPQGPAPSSVSQVDAVEPVEVAVDSGATRGAEPVGAGSGGAESGGAEPGGAEPGGAESGGAEPGGAESEGAEPGGAEPGGAESARVASRGASSRRELLSPQELREWFARRWSRAAGAGGSPVAPGPGGARIGGTGAVGTGGGPTPVVATSSEGGVKHVREESALTVQTAWTWSSSTAFVLTSMAPLPDGRHVAVADRANHIILKIELPLSATSAVSVLAGNNGTNGFMDGRGELALFDTPMHLAADCRGNLFVVDRNSYLRVVSPQGDVTTIRRSSSVSHLAPPQPPFMHSTHAPTTTTLVLDPPVRALLARTRHSDETQSPSASPCAGISGGEKQPLHFHSKPRHADPAKLGSGVSGMWYNASSGVLYVVDTGRQRIAAFAPATTTAAAAAAAAAHAAGNAAGYVAVTTEAAGSVAATGSGVSFRGDAGIPGCLCSAKNSSGGGGGQDAPSSSAWNATWRDTEVAGGAFAVGVLCAHGKPILTATAAGTSHLASTLSLIFHRIASTALAVLMLLFSLPSRFMQQPLGTDPDNTTTSSSSTMQWPLILHPSTQQHGGGEQREEEGVIPPKASLLSLAWPFRSSAARPEAPAAVEENEESGLLISFSDEEDAVGGGNADDTSPSITSQHAPGAPLDIMQLHSSAEMPVSTGSSVDSTARVMTGKEFDRAVASGDAAGAASAAGSTAGAALGRNGDGTAASSFSDLVGKWAGGAHLGEGEKRDTRRDVSS
ncbi:unnamed protein product [Closterium sp. NIES-53]